MVVRKIFMHCNSP